MVAYIKFVMKLPKTVGRKTVLSIDEVMMRPKEETTWRCYTLCCYFY